MAGNSNTTGVTGWQPKRGATLELWFTPLQAIGIAALLAALCISPASAGGQVFDRSPPACIACDVATAEPFDVPRDPMRTGIASLPDGLHFHVEALVSSIELGSAGQQHSIYLVPGLHWRTDLTAHFGIGVASGSAYESDGPVFLAAFNIRFE